MSERTVTELRADILAYCDTPREMKEIIDHMRGESRDIIEALVINMSARRQLMIAPGTCAKKWTTAAHARAMQTEADQA